MFENTEIPKDLIPTDPRFGCGPSKIPVEFVRELADSHVHLLGTSHRKPTLKKLVGGIQDGLRKYFKLPEDYSVVLGNGGATFLFDAVPLGMVKKKITHFTCGEFSQKWFQSSKMIPWIEAEEVSVPYGQGIRGEDRGDSDVIACTLNETSTGVIMDEFPFVDDNTLLVVDATSGGGQVPCDISKVDVFFFSPQKVFASEGGLYVAILSPKARARALEIAEDSKRYIPGIMNWKVAIDNSAKKQTYTTPSVSTLFFLERQVDRMNKVGLDAVIEDGQKKAELVYGWAQERPYLSPYIEEKEFRSLTVATIDVDEKIPVNDLLKRLYEEKIVYNIESYRKLGRNQFRIAMFYNISYEDLDKLTKLLSYMIESELK